MDRYNWRSHTLRVSLLLFAGVASTACASAGSSANAASESAKVTPPRRLPQTFKPSQPLEYSSVDAKIEVMIDERGDADMTTFKIFGQVTPANREVLRQWIIDSRFAPAEQAGQPVAGLFEMSIKSTVLPTVR